MITIEQVEKLRQYADVNFEEAKAALEATEGDLLEAVIYLEKRGKIQKPQNNGTYHSKDDPQGESNEQQQDDSRYTYEETKEEYYTLGSQLKKLWAGVCSLVRKANTNYFVLSSRDGIKTMIPVTVLILGLVFFFWIVCPLLVLGLFFGWRYQFSGPDLGKEKINDMMDTVGNTADDLRRSMMEEHKKHANSKDNHSDHYRDDGER